MKEKSRELYFSKGKPLCFPKSATNNKNGSEVGKDKESLSVTLGFSLQRESARTDTPCLSGPFVLQGSNAAVLLFKFLTDIRIIPIVFSSQ